MTRRLPLVVIGCGPTGIAALVHARFEGIVALGLEAGPEPLAGLHRYMEQLVLVSPAQHYEVAEIPLDCRDPDELTREEVLSYFARLIALARIDVRCDARCVALEDRGDHVTIELAAGPALEAEHVVVAAWYEPQPIPQAWLVAAGPAVLRGLARPSQVAGRRVAFVGGGLSAFEQSTAVMMQGQPVHVIARDRFGAFFHAGPYRELVAATGSTLVDGAHDIQPIRGGLSWSAPDGAGSVACDVVVGCLGSRLSPAIASLLVAAGVLDRATLDRIASAPTIEQLARRGELQDRAGAVERILAARPDLWEHVFGDRRIRLAGGALHAGGADAGVVSSILTARLAVEAIAGKPRPPGFEPPLAAAISRWVRAEPWRESPAFDRVAALRPLAVRSWTRHTPRLLSEGAEGELGHTTTAITKYLRGDASLGALASSILEAADGMATVAELADDAELHDPIDRAALVQALGLLWRAGALTWLPPG
jgi:hypothetical protein